MPTEIYNVEKQNLDNNLIYITDGEYIADNGLVKGEFYQALNKVIYKSNERSVSWTPITIKYADENGMEDEIYSVQEAPLEVKANYARFNRSWPDIDDWFIMENNKLKHQILLQGFQRDPMPWLSGNIDFIISGNLEFDPDLKIMVDGAEQLEDFETNGSIALYDPEEKYIFSLPPIVCYDSKIPDRSQAIGKYKARIAAPGVLYFEIVVNNEWISSTERVYPIVIDPTLVASAAALGIQCNQHKIVRTSNNISFIFYISSANLKYKYSSDNGATWSAEQSLVLSPAVTNVDFSVDVDEDNNLHICFFSSNYTYYSFGMWNGSNGWSSYSTPTSLCYDPNSGYGDVVAGRKPNGASGWRAYVAAPYCSVDNGYLIYKIDISITGVVSGPVQITGLIGTGSTAGTYSIHLDKTNGNLVFSISCGAIGYGYAKITYTSTSDSYEVKAGDTLYNGYPPKSNIIKDSGGNVYNAAYNSSYLKVFKNGTAILDQVCNCIGAVIETDQSGKIFVFYVLSTGILYYKIYDGASWGAAVQLDFVYTSQGVLSIKRGKNGARLEMIGINGGNSIIYNYYAFNVPPSAPTLTPKNGFDAAQATDFNWTFSDPDAGNTQSAYQLQIIRVSDGATVKDTGKVVSATASYTLPAGTLANNVQYQWKVTTWDNNDVSGPYSTLATFTTAAAPTATITAPAADGATITTSNVTANWNFSDPQSLTQLKYQVKLTDNANVVLYDSGVVTDAAARALTINYTLANATTYKIKVTLWNSAGIASAEVVRTFNVSFTPPAIPTITTTPDNNLCKITINIANPTPVGAQPTVNSNDIYRDNIKIASVVNNGSFIDNTVNPGQNHSYYVIANGSNTTTSQSATVAATATIKNAQLLLVSDPSQYASLIVKPQRSKKVDIEGDLMKFSGRSKPVIDYGEHLDTNLNLSFMILTAAELLTLENLIQSKKTLLYRDNYGRKVYCNITAYSIIDELPNYWTISFSISEISYIEGV